MTTTRAMFLGALLGAALAAAAVAALDYAPLAVVNALRLPGGYTTQPDQRYRLGERGLLDVYVPLAPANRTPVVVFFYGGGWRSGTKEDYKFVGAALSSAGALVVIPDYRLYPSAHFPEFLEDGASAVRWTRDNARRLGADPKTIVLMGHSAGAYIAAMLALDSRWLDAVGLNSEHDLAGWIGLAGPYELASDHEPIKGGPFESVVEPASAEPITFATAAAPPAFLAAGLADHAVDPSSTLALAKRIRENGGSVVIELYPGLGHRQLIGAFSPLLKSFGPVERDVIGFVFGLQKRSRN